VIGKIANLTNIISNNDNNKENEVKILEKESDKKNRLMKDVKIKILLN
jgi:hypothetical protein